jgi:type IV pilus assembly protein PilB
MAAQAPQLPVKNMNADSTDAGNSGIVDILVAQGDLTQQRADQVKFAEIQSGKPQEDIIREQNIVSDEALVKARATFYNVPFIDLRNTPVNPAALSILSQEIAKKFKVFPISADAAKKELSLAMGDPLDLTAIEFIEQKSGYHVRPFAAVPETIDEFIAKRYSTTLSQEVTAALKEVSGDGRQIHSLDISKQQQGGLIRQERISEVVTHILDFAVRSRASDVHIEPLETSTRVRYRIDGILQEKLTIPHELHDSLVSRIKILSGMKIDEKRIPQDGRFNFKNADQEVDLRVSTLPTSWGEKIVMRLLKKTGGMPELTTLGLRGRALKNLEDAILRPHGIITICGPTGSGKTTTLYSVIQRLNTPKVNIMTLEDPIEYKIAGVNQVQINPQVGLTFASGLRSFLRQDPNIILVGEIRDKETAELAVQASLTGHLVFATLHTNDSAGALPRLLDMGAEPFLLASSMTAIVAQRVLRKIDEKSKEAYDPDPNILAEMKRVLGPLFPADKQIKFYRGKPTPENNNSGYHGRVGVYEVLPVTDTITQLILKHAPASDIEAMAKKEGMITMKQDGYLKVLEGITTIEEVLRVAQE